eukprot:5409591-Prymnesium_polylepis.1
MADAERAAVLVMAEVEAAALTPAREACVGVAAAAPWSAPSLRPPWTPSEAAERSRMATSQPYAPWAASKYAVKG